MADDFDAAAISMSKAMADGSKYFSLLEKHIPRNIAGDVMLVSVGNLDCIASIMSLNPEAKYWIIDQQIVLDAARTLFESKYKMAFIRNGNLDLYNMIKSIGIQKGLPMKFDCIVMNPPYQRNLHLKILAEAIKHLKDEKSVCVNLSPVRWLQDPLAKYKKNCDLKRFEESVAKHIESLEYSFKEVNDKLFNIDFGTLGLYVCSKDANHDYTKFTIQNDILDKVVNEMKKKNIPSIDTKIVYDDMPGICCLTSLLVFGVRDRELRLINGWLTQSTDILFYTDRKNDKSGETYFDYRKRVAWGNLKPKAENTNIKFNSVVERQNFYNIWRTKFFRYIYDVTVVDVHVHSEFLPFLGDAVNPRTGKKGYTGDWTDADLYKFFNITPEEQKVIEETMKKYDPK